MEYDNILSTFNNPILLKKGGQKVVYKAIHTQFGEVALKIGKYKSNSNLERIKREVQVLKDIDSKYYPKNYDFKVISNNTFIIIEEYIDSAPLTESLHKFNQPEEIMIFIKELIIGLSILWKKRIVHRDIKPDNILLNKSRSPIIIDLGIAKLLDLESLTRTLAMRGPCTPVYASPEQLNNRKTKIDYRTDQFGIGILLMQLLLNGKHPFDPDFVGGESIVQNIVADNWYRSFFEDYHLEELYSLVSKMLGVEPYMRYRKINSLISDIDELLEGFQK